MYSCYYILGSVFVTRIQCRTEPTVFTISGSGTLHVSCVYWHIDAALIVCIAVYLSSLSSGGMSRYIHTMTIFFDILCTISVLFFLILVF